MLPIKVCIMVKQMKQMKSGRTFFSFSLVYEDDVRFLCFEASPHVGSNQPDERFAVSPYGRWV